MSINLQSSQLKSNHFYNTQIDAVAKSRDGKFRIVSNDEREQTLNQLLTVSFSLATLFSPPLFRFGKFFHVQVRQQVRI